MMNKKAVLYYIAACLTAVCLSGCLDHQVRRSDLSTEYSIPPDSLHGDTRQEDRSYTTPQTENSTPVQDELPALPDYVYSGDDPILKAIYGYFVSQNADVMDGDVYIPTPIILKTDEQGEEIWVYGVIWDFWYEQKEDNLFCTRGGSSTGRLRLLRDGKDLKVIEFEKARDGGDFVVDLKRICGEDTQLYQTFLSAETRESNRERVRAMLVVQYIDDNHLPINSYQDFGWEPVRVMTQSNTTFPDLGMRILLPDNRDWVDHPRYGMVDENTAQVSYRDKFLDIDMTPTRG